jgi:hypothetical protein
MQKDTKSIEKDILNIENQLKRLKKDLETLKNASFKPRSGEKTLKKIVRNIELEVIKAEYQVFLLKNPAAI